MTISNNQTGKIPTIKSHTFTAYKFTKNYKMLNNSHATKQKIMKSK